jgi:3-O-methylgallate 3,4-dioxygenase
MAELVVGIGTSHAPQLSTPPGEWGQRATADRRNPALAYRGRDYTYEDLRAARPSFADECRPEIMAEHHARRSS